MAFRLLKAGAVIASLLLVLRLLEQEGGVIASLLLTLLRTGRAVIASLSSLRHHAAMTPLSGTTRRWHLSLLLDGHSRHRSDPSDPSSRCRFWDLLGPL